MQRKDKPFVLYRYGPMHFTIAPRGAMGWAQLTVWLILAAPLLIWLIEHATTPTYARTAALGDVIFLSLFGLIAWAIAGLWWMRAHAEEIDIGVHRRDLQRAQRERERAKNR
jgi:hypothetical protein